MCGQSAAYNIYKNPIFMGFFTSWECFLEAIMYVVKINYIRFEKLAFIIIVIDKWEEDNI